MGWSQFPIKIFGVHFGNSVLDKYNWDKISQSLTKNHTHVMRVGHTSEFPFGIYWWPLKNPKNQTFEKIKKIFWIDITILHMCTKNHNHMNYGFRDAKWDRNVCHFGTFFDLLTRPLTTHKTKILWKNEKSI